MYLKHYLKIKYLFGLALLFFVFAAPAPTVGQPVPEFLVSWRAINYVPADYQGKILSSKGSIVEMGFDLIEKNKLANLSQFNILWFSNENLIASGVGLKTISFPITGNLSRTIRITVSGYAAEDLTHNFILPVTAPEVVTDTKTPTKIISNQIWLPMQNYNFEARLFFFNVLDLSGLKFRWRINDQLQNIPENSSALSLNLSSQGVAQETPLTISVSAINLSNQLEFANKLMNYIVK